MKKFGDENNQTGEQEYSGLTITELEKKLISEEPESRIKSVFQTVSRWGRLLIALSLAVILLYGIFYIQSLKKEIKGLRMELNARPDGISQVDNIEQKPIEEAPPDSSQEEDDEQGQSIDEAPPDSSQEEDEGQEQPVEEASPDNSQEENDGQSQPAAENPPNNTPGKNNGQIQPAAEIPPDTSKEENKELSIHNNHTITP